MNLTAIFFFVVGLGLLVLGAELLVRGAARLAIGLGLSPLIIGLTVVAFGTSSPELAVSVYSGIAGQADIALGNVVGSNIFNVLFILGLSAMISQLTVSRQLKRFDVPIMINVSVLTLIFGLDGKIERSDGVLLFAGIVGYTILLVNKGRRENRLYVKVHKEGSLIIVVLLIIIGLTLLVIGSHWLVSGAVVLARVFGVSQLVIGLTIVTAGTSLPEVATSVVAAIRGERDIAIGNVVGSNIFNILAVLGLSSIISSDGITVASHALRFDIPVMIAVAIICLPIFFTGGIIARWEGILLFSYYCIYTAYIVLQAMHHAFLPMLRMITVVFLPVTILAVMIQTMLYLRKKGNSDY